MRMAVTWDLRGSTAGFAPSFEAGLRLRLLPELKMLPPPVLEALLPGKLLFVPDLR